MIGRAIQAPETHQAQLVVNRLITQSRAGTSPIDNSGVPSREPPLLCPVCAPERRVAGQPRAVEVGPMRASPVDQVPGTAWDSPGEPHDGPATMWIR